MYKRQSDTNGIGPVVWGSDGEQSGVIDKNVDLLESGRPGVPAVLTMEGQAVFRWATGFIADAARRTLAVSGVDATELDVFAPHQANNRITDSMLRHLKLPSTVKVARTIKTMGNNSAASIPIALDSMLASGEAKSGDKALIIGFGAGLVLSLIHI